MKGLEVGALEIWIGDLVEYELERSTLREIERLLADDGRRAIVFANFEVTSRQIDLLVALDDIALVIEAKGRTRPIQGGENGDWQVHLASAHWKNFRNPYRQALGAALAVKDAADAFADTGASYIDAALVFVPGIPPDSRAFQGNHKVSVIGQDGLRAELGKQRSGAWSVGRSVDRWREFADRLGLTRASSVGAACDPELAQAEDRLRQYTAMFCRTYGKGKLWFRSLAYRVKRPFRLPILRISYSNGATCCCGVCRGAGSRCWQKRPAPSSATGVPRRIGIAARRWAGCAVHCQPVPGRSDCHQPGCVVRSHESSRILSPLVAFR